MTIQYINTGSSANAGDGDSLRSAFNKVNSNFAFVQSIAATGYTGSEGFGYTGSAGLGYTGSAGAGYTGSAGTSGTALGDRLTAGTTATLVLLADGTLKLTHPTEWWSGDYSLEIQKAAGNYHTFKSAYGLSLQATPVPNGYGLNTNTNFVDIFHDGVSVNVNDNTWTFGTDGILTTPGDIVLPYGTIGSGTLDGIKLTTDRGTVLFGNTPECVPTLASHFHIMRDDPTTVDLFFGDDNNYVKLPYYSTLTNVGVEISADGYSWQFGADGVLTLPGGNTRIGNFNGTDAIIGSTGTGVGLAGQGTGGYVVLEWISDGENITTSTQVAAVVVNSPIASSSGTVQIATGLVTGPTAQNVWEFSADGKLTVPDDIQDANGSVIRIATTSTAPTRVEGQLWFNTIDGRGYIRYDNTWLDLSPPEVPAPSTYLDGLTIEGTTISTVDTTASIYVSGDLVPELDKEYDLGSADRQWKSLYVSTSTIYIGGTPLSVDATGNLTVDGNPVSGALPSVLGVVTFPGDLLIGTLWPNDPMPGGDKESVVWAKDDTEYLGLWWGGSQTYPEEFYGPVAGIMIGTGDGSMTDDFVQGPSPTGTNITLAINDDMGTLEWVFGRDGFLTFPNTNLQIGELYGLVGMLGGTDALVGIAGQGNSGAVGLQWLDDLTSATSVASVLLNNGSSGAVEIWTGIPAGPSASNVWEFGTDGELTLPTNGRLGAIDPKGGTMLDGGLGSNVSVTSFYSTGNYSSCVTASAGGQLYITAYNDGGPNPSRQWVFDKDGSLTLPEGGVIKNSTGTNILDGLGGGAGFATTSTLVNGTSTVSLSSTGTLTVPGNIIPDADSIYSLGSPTRKFKDLYVSTTTIYMGDLVISGSPGTGLTINGNSANSKQTFVGGEGAGPDNCALIQWSTGTNYIIVRSPGTNFKLIMEGLKTGNTFNAVSPSDLTFTVSSTLWHFDNEITPGYPEYRIGVNETNVSFSGEYIYLLAVPVPERTNALSNGVSLLTLDSTGTVTLPGPLTFPDTTVQTTAYVASSVVNRTTGSWTLATGSNTVSITVPPNSNYQMWVNGNISNGIVEWNATVNVSNPNVPVIGNQNAWYYYAGNALVLTAIPDQIIGTSGVISTSTGYVGTTSNVFRFGITNNSISTQTVYWGYTTL